MHPLQTPPHVSTTITYPMREATVVGYCEAIAMSRRLL